MMMDDQFEFSLRLWIRIFIWIGYGNARGSWCRKKGRRGKYLCGTPNAKHEKDKAKVALAKIQYEKGKVTMIVM